MPQRIRNPIILTFPLFLIALFFNGTAEAKPGDGKPGKTSQPGKVIATNSPAVQSTQGVVNLNTATEEQLRLLPHIGPAKAKRIIQYRTKQKFKTTWDLIRVKGIGRKTYGKLRPYLAVQGETTLSTRPKLD